MTTPFDPNKFVFFYGHGARAGEFAYMSNFSPSKLIMTHECIGGPCSATYTYPTAEHAIMHLKACLMGDGVIADQILSANTPFMAKKLGRKVKPWDQEKWNSKVEDIAYAVLSAKFQNNEALSHKLRGTKDKILAEASPRDKIWGIGIGVDKAKNGGDWKGRNLLGKTLMKVRADLM